MAQGGGAFSWRQGDKITLGAKLLEEGACGIKLHPGSIVVT
jgi:hypothetical protein